MWIVMHHAVTNVTTYCAASPSLIPTTISTTTYFKPMVSRFNINHQERATMLTAPPACPWWTRKLPCHPWPNANAPHHQPTTVSLPLPLLNLRDVGIRTLCHVIVHIWTLMGILGLSTEGWANQQGVRCINGRQVYQQGGGHINKGRRYRQWAGVSTGGVSTKGGHIDWGQGVSTGGILTKGRINVTAKPVRVGEAPLALLSLTLNHTPPFILCVWIWLTRQHFTHMPCRWSIPSMYLVNYM